MTSINTQADGYLTCAECGEESESLEVSEFHQMVAALKAWKAKNWRLIAVDEWLCPACVNANWWQQ